MATTVGDEGGFAPNLDSHEAALKLIVQADRKSRPATGIDVAIGVDCAASEFYKDGLYHIDSEGLKLSSAEFTDYLVAWCDSYPIISIEDAMAEGDWDGWKILTDKLGRRVQLVGDDLFVTNTRILKEGIDKDIANSILIKVNQIGTLSETFQAIEMAKQAGYTSVISHRSGETEDTTIADLAVATNARQIKTGSLSRSDRMAKYNQLLRIEEELGDTAIYPDAMLSASAAEWIARLRSQGLTWALAVAIVLLQYPLWLGEGGWLKVREGAHKIDIQQALNQRMQTAMPACWPNSATSSRDATPSKSVRAMNWA